MLDGRQQEIHAERDRKLEVARKQRQVGRQQAARRAKSQSRSSSASRLKWITCGLPTTRELSVGPQTLGRLDHDFERIVGDSEATES